MPESGKFIGQILWTKAEKIKRNLLGGEAEVMRTQPKCSDLWSVEEIECDELETERKHGPGDHEGEIIFRDESQGLVIAEWTWWSFGVEGV